MSNERSDPTLVACPACGSQVSNQAAACPRCGQPITAGHIPPQPHQRATPHNAQKRTLTEGEDILRILGMLTSRLWNWGSTQLGMKSQEKLQPFSVTDKMKLGLLGLLVFLVLTLIVVVPLLSDHNTNRHANNNNRVESGPSPALPSPTTLAIDSSSPDYQDGFKRGLREGNGWVKQFKGGTTPPPALITAVGQTQAEKLKPKNAVLWQSGWEDGFAKGYTSAKWAGRQQDEYEQLSWGNAKPKVKLYDDNGKLRMTVVSVDQTAGIITVKYPKENGGAIENKLLDAMSKILLVRKDDPALNP